MSSGLTIWVMLDALIRVALSLGLSLSTIEIADFFEQPLDIALVEDYSKVEDLYTSFALVTTALKLDMATILEMEIPVEASGDND